MTDDKPEEEKPEASAGRWCDHDNPYCGCVESDPTVRGVEEPSGDEVDERRASEFLGLPSDSDPSGDEFCHGCEDEAQGNAVGHPTGGRVHTCEPSGDEDVALLRSFLADGPLVPDDDAVDRALNRLQARLEGSAVSIFRLSARLRDMEGWTAQYRKNSERIGEALEPFREKRHTGEPARSDPQEVEALAARLREAEVEPGRLAGLAEKAMRRCNTAEAEVGRLVLERDDAQKRVVFLERAKGTAAEATFWREQCEEYRAIFQSVGIVHDHQIAKRLTQMIDRIKDEAERKGKRDGMLEAAEIVEYRWETKSTCGCNLKSCWRCSVGKDLRTEAEKLREGE